MKTEAKSTTCELPSETHLLLVAWIVSRVHESRTCWPDRRAFHNCLLVLRASEVDGARGFSVVTAGRQRFKLCLIANRSVPKIPETGEHKTRAIVWMGMWGNYSVWRDFEQHRVEFVLLPVTSHEDGLKPRSHG